MGRELREGGGEGVGERVRELLEEWRDGEGLGMVVEGSREGSMLHFGACCSKIRVFGYVI